jgi:hypothetical protein
MTVYAILTRNPQQDFVGAVSRAFPEAQMWSNHVAFVQDAGSAIDVSRRIGVRARSADGSEVLPGLDQIVVIEVSPNYWGFTDSALWAWLKKSFEAAG